MEKLISRRLLLSGGGAAMLLVAGGCSRSAPQAKTGDQPEPRPDSHQLAMTVYRDPSCGCCEAWALLARQAGFHAELRDEADMAVVKRRLNVPQSLASCHTAVSGGLVFEGHVPLDQVHRLLRTLPPGVRGLAVPGMPIGSPGMEAPDGRREPYEVLAFDAQGRTSIFHRVA